MLLKCRIYHGLCRDAHGCWREGGHASLRELRGVGRLVEVSVVRAGEGGEPLLVGDDLEARPVAVADVSVEFCEAWDD